MKYRTEPCTICGEGVLLDQRLNYGNQKPTHWSCREDRNIPESYPKVTGDGDLTVTIAVLRELPPRHKLRGVYDQVPDMYGTEHRALRLLWNDSSGPRDAYFRMDNGKYLCDHID